ncbi:MAG TPA: type I methionyl aminopeptidase [Acidobacteriaceae bacterium]|nr:type I methionyl aminopeptidase [Acidobacteriaceae bacterium]
MAIMIKTPQEIEKMRRSGQVVREILEHVRQLVKVGASTQDLEDAAAEKMKELGAKPAFKGYHGYPCVLCTSVNDEVVHGIPSARRVLQDGDIVSIDTGVIIDSYYGDSATTIAVGSKIPEKTRKLLEVTEASLQRGIEAIQPGATLGDIGAAVQEVVEAGGFSVVRDFVGHGIGTRLHEDPQVPNYGKRGQGQKLREGMVIAIEPMVNVGRPDVQVLSDGWTAVTQDGSLSAHFEHTVAVTAQGADILTQ